MVAPLPRGGGEWARDDGEKFEFYAGIVSSFDGRWERSSEPLAVTTTSPSIRTPTFASIWRTPPVNPFGGSHLPIASAGHSIARRVALKTPGVFGIRVLFTLMLPPDVSGSRIPALAEPSL